MTTATLTRLDADIVQLSLDEQLWLIERLAQHIRRRSQPSIAEHELVAMASDPEMQRELAHIATEFAATDTDGLSLFCSPIHRESGVGGQLPNIGELHYRAAYHHGAAKG